MNMALVLPPIPTAGLTADDVSALTVRVRDQMLTTLRGISVQVPLSKLAPSSDPAERGSGLADQGTSISLAEVDSGVEMPSETVTPSKFETVSTTVSQLPKKDGSENGTETEEDEGMVLVGRPQ